MELLKSARRRALKLGALFPLRNQIFFLWDSVLEINFELRVAEILTKKVSADNSLAFQKNPFLPYDSELYICDLGNSHVCLLNKYSVVKNHILVVTKNYRHQSDSLTQDDIEAWKMGIKMLKGIGFFNCGPESGASQPHKHFQVIPGKSELINELYSQGVKDGDTINKHPKLKFKHGYICFKGYSGPYYKWPYLQQQAWILRRISVF
ncbi:uncharacterized protein LOC135121387 [Zophobas morio]|uniref:uncharacterized protein LOC135121387 n=1 Tax=Zophobas morio TaxID=2755281 RepID=UPI003082BEC6